MLTNKRIVSKSNKRQKRRMTDTLLDKVADLTECPICKEAMHDPRILHCVHTFCCDCLVKYGKGYRPGERMACPVCRTEFNIPFGGLADLPKNFFIEKLCEAQSDEFSSSLNSSRQNSEEINFTGRSSNYKLNRHLCPRHVGNRNSYGDVRNKDGYENHQLRRTSYSVDMSNDKDKISNPIPHFEEESFCEDCEQPLCDVCLNGTEKNHHENHRFCSVDDYYEKSKEILEIDAEKINRICHDVETEMAKVRDIDQQFRDSIDKMKEITKKRGEEIKHLIERQVQVVHNELETKKHDYNKDCSQVLTNLQIQRTQLESFRTYTKGVASKADPWDLACNAKDLKVRATELLGTRIATLKELNELNLQSLDTDLLEDSTYNLIGQIIHVKTPMEPPYRTLDYDRTPALIQTLQPGEEVMGLTVVNGLLYTTSCNTSDINVYDAMTFDFVENFYVENLMTPSDIASTSAELFIFDNQNLTVHKVDLKTKYSKNWSIQLKSRRLNPASPNAKEIALDFSHVAVSFSFYKAVCKCFSLTKHETIILFSPSNFQREIIEFNKDGQVLREIALTFFVHEPRHILMLDDNEFLLCYGSTNYSGHVQEQLCLVNSDGKLVKKLSNPNNELGQPAESYYLASNNIQELLSPDKDGTLTQTGMNIYSRRLSFSEKEDLPAITSSSRVSRNASFIGKERDVSNSRLLFNNKNNRTKGYPIYIERSREKDGNEHNGATMNLINGGGKVACINNNVANHVKDQTVGSSRITHFAVDHNGYYFMCSSLSDSVQLYDPNLDFVKNLIPVDSELLSSPSKVYLEKETGRLFVANSGNKSIRIFQLF